MSSRMLRSKIQSEILDLPVPSRHGKERCLRNKKEIIPLERRPVPPVLKMHLLRPRASTWLAALHASEALLAAINSSLSDDWCSQSVPSIVPDRRIMAPRNHDIQQLQHISLRARDFYAGLPSRLCVEKKRQLKQIESIFFLCQPTTWYQATG